MTDHADIDALAANLPAVRPPPNDAPILVRLWWAVRTLWSRVHIRRWRTVRDTGVHQYQQHVHSGDRRVRHTGGCGYQAIARDWLAGGDFGSCERLPPHGNKDLAAIDAETDRLRALADDLRERQRRAPSSPNVNEARVIATRRLTAMVNDAKSTPIPLLDDLSADIQAARFAGSSGSNAASIEVLSMLRRRLLTDLPSVNASEIFADLGIDPDPPGTTHRCVVPVWVQNLRISGTILSGDSNDRSAWRTWSGRLPCGVWALGQRDGGSVHVRAVRLPAPKPVSGRRTG